MSSSEQSGCDLRVCEKVKLAIKRLIEDMEKSAIAIINGSISIASENGDVPIDLSHDSLQRNFGHVVNYAEIAKTEPLHHPFYNSPEWFQPSIIDKFRDLDADIMGGKIFILRNGIVEKLCFCYGCQRMKRRCQHEDQEEDEIAVVVKEAGIENLIKKMDTTDNDDDEEENDKEVLNLVMDALSSYDVEIKSGFLNVQKDQSWFVDVCFCQQCQKYEQCEKKLKKIDVVMKENGAVAKMLKEKLLDGHCYLIQGGEIILTMDGVDISVCFCHRCDRKKLCEDDVIMLKKKAEKSPPVLPEVDNVHVVFDTPPASPDVVEIADDELIVIDVPPPLPDDVDNQLDEDVDDQLDEDMDEQINLALKKLSDLAEEGSSICEGFKQNHLSAIDEDDAENCQEAEVDTCGRFPLPCEKNDNDDVTPAENCQEAGVDTCGRFLFPYEKNDDDETRRADDAIKKITEFLKKRNYDVEIFRGPINNPVWLLNQVKQSIIEVLEEDGSTNGSTDGSTDENLVINETPMEEDNVDVSADGDVNTLEIDGVDTRAIEAMSDPDFVLPLKKRRKKQITFHHDESDEDLVIETHETFQQRPRTSSEATTVLPDHDDDDESQKSKPNAVEKLFPYVPEDFMFQKEIVKKKSLFTVADDDEMSLQRPDGNSVYYDRSEFLYFEYKDKTLYGDDIRLPVDWIETVSRPIFQLMKTTSGRLLLETVMLDYTKQYTNGGMFF